MARATIPLDSNTQPKASQGRATWSGFLKVGPLSVPVKAYPMVSTNDEPDLNQLHADCGQRIQYRKHCPTHGEIDAANIVKGYRCGPDQYVVLDEADSKIMKPQTNKELILQLFLDPQEVDLALFAGRSYLLHPDGPLAQRPYLGIAEVLQRQRKAGLGQLAVLGRRNLVLVHPSDRQLTMYFLYYPQQLKVLAEAIPPSVHVSKDELKVLEKPIRSASQKVRWSDFRDDTRDKLTALIEAKIQYQQSSVPTNGTSARRGRRAVKKSTRKAA